MNITKDIITDLYPLYAERECSADTRALVEAYLRDHPQEAEELRRVWSAAGATRNPAPPAAAAALAEQEALRRARRRVRGNAWIMGLAIFFSLAPFSVNNLDGRVHWLFLDHPAQAAGYGLVGVALWAWLAVRRRRAAGI